MNGKELRAEKVRFLYAGSAFILLMSAASALILVLVHWELFPPSVLIGWLSVHVAILVARALLILAYRRDPSGSKEDVWLRRFRLSVLLGGSSWGVAGVILSYSGDPVYQTFVAFGLAGINAGAITALAVDRMATLAFVAPSLLPLALRFLLDPHRLSLVTGLIVLLFLIFLAVTVSRIERYLRENARLRLMAETQRQEIQTNEMRWRIAVEGSGLDLWDWDLERDRVFYSGRWKSMADSRERQGGSPVGEWSNRIHPDDRSWVLSELERHFCGEISLYETEHRIRGRDGGYTWVMDQGRVIEHHPDGSPKRMIGIHMDISERKSAETELRIAATVFESQEAVIVTDVQERILRVNQAFVRMTGYSNEEVIGQTPRLFKSGRHDEAFYIAMWASIHECGAWKGEIWNRRKSGEIYPQWLGITAIRADEGRVTHYVATLHDITERKAVEQAIQHLAFYDALTGLPNRRLLFDRLCHAQIVSERSRRCGVLLFIDLDRFKELNDRLGHPMGDLLLQQVASRLCGVVRDVDTVARLGGDEFVIMLEDLSSDEREAEHQAREIGAKVLHALSLPYQLGEHRHQSTPSIGAVLFCGHDPSAEQLIGRADLAMYQAKQSGRGRLRFFEQQMQTSVDERSAMKDELRRGIDLEQFVLLYQPQVDRQGVVQGAEVLLRWTHPLRAEITPREFIPMAEESGFILPLGYWVLQSACDQLAAWSRNPRWRHLNLSINISGHQFRDPRFVDEVRTILDRSGVDPGHLKLEINECLLLQEGSAIVERMKALQALGLGLSLDNFGTGYSSLTEIKDLPLTQLKLGQPLIRELLKDPRVASIARSLIELGHALGLHVLAAGVETQAQRTFLQRHACHAFQGYLFSRPLAARELTEFSPAL